ncbi:hypothetical protein H2198_009176 [Neophaeococcomyces mojaviensis]|uniref:Uncharacterized protein n=1 Tax=Neophaeococcomyces mojaviensis TaxID=3383035 RepID=A0ACC2ZVT9_9EURO|nr:hypothetical protein H2198_009176 [Knufia sp. JES_112]
MERLPLDHLPPLSEAETAQARLRWANTTFRKIDGTWSQYLVHKVQRVFPDLKLPDFAHNGAASTRFTCVVGIRHGAQEVTTPQSETLDQEMRTDDLSV